MYRDADWQVTAKEHVILSGSIIRPRNGPRTRAAGVRGAHATLFLLFRNYDWDGRNAQNERWQCTVQITFMQTIMCASSFSTHRWMA